MNIIAQNLKKIIQDNGSKFFAVTFTKANGEERTLNGHLRYVAGRDGANTVAHKEQYVTVVLAQKDAKGREQFRNVNVETIKSLSIDGVKLSIEA